MTHYLLDTNIPLYLERRESPFHLRVREQFEQLEDHDEVFVSVLSVYELHYGVQCRLKEGKEKLASQSKSLIQDVLQKFQVLSLSPKGAAVFGELKAAYKMHYPPSKDPKKQNIKKHDVDLMIASLALLHNMVVVSNDQLFSKIRKFRPEFQWANWVQD